MEHHKPIFETLGIFRRKHLWFQIRRNTLTSKTALHQLHTVKDLNRWFTGEGLEAMTVYSHSGNKEGHFIGSRDIWWWKISKISKGQLNLIRENNQDVNSNRYYLGTEISQIMSIVLGDITGRVRELVCRKYSPSRKYSGAISSGSEWLIVAGKELSISDFKVSGITSLWVYE